MKNLLKGKATKAATLEFLSKKFTPVEGWKLPNTTSTHNSNASIEHLIQSQNNHNLPFYFSKVGFGGHSLSMNDSEGESTIQDQEFAIQKAIQGGVNLIDTSADYGTSQMMIGHVLNGMCAHHIPNHHQHVHEQLVDSGKIYRDELVLMSKVGPLDNYVDERNHSVLSKLVHECQVEDLNKRIITLPDKLHHYSLDPLILSHEITRCLREYQVETLDVLIINQPERMLQAMLMSEDRDSSDSAVFAEFYHKLEQAFKCLESEVERGRIQSYGIASKSITKAPGPGILSIDLNKCLKIAEHVYGNKDHHFRVVQVPYNLHEKNVYTDEIFTDKNGHRANFLTMAKSHKLATMAYRPLNAQLDSHLIFRFADYDFDKKKNDMESIVQEYQKISNEIAFNELNTPWYTVDLSDDSVHLSKEVQQCTLPEMSEQNLIQMRPSISWGHIIMTNYDQLESYFTFEKVLRNRIIPEQKYIFSKLAQMSNRVNENDYNAVGMKKETTGSDANSMNNFKSQCNRWLSHYQRLCNKFYSVYSDLLSLKHQHQCEDLHVKLSKLSNGDLDSYKTLSQKSIRCLVDTPNLDTVLVGMDKTKYVDEILFEATNNEYSLLQSRPKEYQQVVDNVIRNVAVNNFRLIVDEDPHTANLNQHEQQ
ncbi:predicted protein [Naegleria gruberi]|uniref:Predicted protein n=1 Tax=Naegleria gruberi TaxID=5762 RepID=D2VNG7_NAEGR|nr:uncharacterized protein NAEGRDRAFT_70493 [Naegleria gruberi]EFC41659.1 predicted protein [Naegleria gruberi]|eukprot:XP_002674403.1 predicted protein [Naegleria gruberi strain NEG-M]